MMDRSEIEPDYIKIYGMEPYPASSCPNGPPTGAQNCNLIHRGYMTCVKGEKLVRR